MIFQPAGHSNFTTPAFVLGGGVNALEVVRSLGRHRIPVTLFSNDVSKLARRSRYVDCFHPAPGDPEELARLLLEAGERSQDRPVLLFTSDEFLEFLSTYRHRLAASFRLIIAEETPVSIVLNKGNFNQFTEQEKLPAPRGIVISVDEIGTVEGKNLNYPLVAKPLYSVQWRSEAFHAEFPRAKAIRFDSSTELAKLLPALMRHTSELLLQEVILGSDDSHYSVLVYRSPRFGEVFRLCVNKQRIWPIHNGAGSFCRVVPEAPMEEIASEVLDRLGWIGLASVCFKVDSRTGLPVIHEVNGRLPQFHGIAQAAGIDLPFLMYLDAIERELPVVPPPSNAATYRIFSKDCAALLAYRRAGDLTPREVLRSAFQADSIAEFARDDWRPFLGVVRQALSNLVRGLL